MMGCVVYSFYSLACLDNYFELVFPLLIKEGDSLLIAISILLFASSLIVLTI